MGERDGIHCSYYHSRAALERDLLLIVENCERYNEPGSELVRQAQQLRETSLARVARCFDGVDVPEVSFSPLGVDTRLDTAVNHVIAWLETTLQPLLLEQKTAIVLCKRPLFLSDLRAKCSLHFYRALSELFV